MKDNHYRKLLGLLALASVLTFSASTTDTVHAQSRGQAGFDFMMAIPQGAFGQNVDQVGFGIDGHAAARVAGSPFLMGIDVGVQVYGNERRYVPLSMTIPDITARVRTTNNIAYLHGMLRIQPATGSVRPYLDGLFGFKYLYTETALEDDFRYEETVLSSTNYDDFAPSYGLGAGIDFRVFNGPMGDDERPGAVYLSVGARYLTGGEANYLREGDIERLPGEIRFTTTRSRVDLVQPRFGVTFAF